MGSCTRINIVYSLSSLSESFSCWFISVLFFSGEESQYEASLMKVDDHWSFLWIYGGLLWGNIVNKCKSRYKLKTLWKIQGRCCWNIYGKDEPQWRLWDSWVVVVFLSKRDNQISQRACLAAWRLIWPDLQAVEAGASPLTGETEGHWVESSRENEDMESSFPWLQLTCKLAEPCVCCWRISWGRCHVLGAD